MPDAEAGSDIAPPSRPTLYAPPRGSGMAPDLARFSLNQITLDTRSLREVALLCAEAGISWLGAWRHKVEPIGLGEARAALREAGLRVSSLCRGGMFPAATAPERARRLDDNRRAIDECAELGSDVLCLVCGPAPDRDIDSARRMVEEGIAKILPYARERGIRLGVEPLHPTFAADRSVVVTLRQANDIVERIGEPGIGVIVDAYNVWWDPELYEQIERARGSIVRFDVGDWAPGVSDPFLGRQIPGDGVIELRRMREAVDATGYSGPIEVELINPSVWELEPVGLLSTLKERFATVV